MSEGAAVLLRSAGAGEAGDQPEEAVQDGIFGVGDDYYPPSGQGENEGMG